MVSEWFWGSKSQRKPAGTLQSLVSYWYFISSSKQSLNYYIIIILTQSHHSSWFVPEKKKPHSDIHKLSQSPGPFNFYQ